MSAEEKAEIIWILIKKIVSRLLLVIVVIAGIVGAWFYYKGYQEEQAQKAAELREAERWVAQAKARNKREAEEKARLAEEKAKRKKLIADALEKLAAPITPEREKMRRRISQRWNLKYAKDPATQDTLVMGAEGVSMEGLCKVGVERTLDGKTFTYIRCPELDFRGRDELELKFSHRSSSYKHSLRFFRGRFYLGYSNLLSDLKKGGILAFRTDRTEGYWIRFDLSSAKGAINLIGKTRP